MITLDQLKRGAAREEAGGLDRPLEHLVACHRRIEDRLAILDRAGRELTNRRDEALQAITNSLAFFDSNVARHTADEEESVFPRLREQLTAEDVACLERLEGDHDVTDELLAQLRDLAARMAASSAPRRNRLQRPRLLESVTALTALFRDHIAFEDAELIRLAQQALFAGSPGRNLRRDESPPCYAGDTGIEPDVR